MNPAHALLTLLYPPSCEGCGAGIERGSYLCPRCKAEPIRIRAPLCQVCSEPLFGAITGPAKCAHCTVGHFHFTCAVAVYRHAGLLREMIHRFKYFSEHRLRHPLAAWLAEALDDPRIRAQPADALVPVPLFPARQRQREFNQAAELARLVGARASLPVADCLLRIRNTEQQVGFDRQRRIENLRNAFTLRDNASVRGRHLLLVDDVLTTGSTLDECAAVPLKCGAASVRAITVTRG